MPKVIKKRRDTRLVKFLRAWLHWAENDGCYRPSSGFGPSSGLCYCAQPYATRVLGLRWDAVENQLKKAFVADGLDTTYPFGGYYRFWNDEPVDAIGLRMRHKDPVRLFWVRSYLARFDAGRI